jgi:hypothetical protein
MPDSFADSPAKMSGTFLKVAKPVDLSRPTTNFDSALGINAEPQNESISCFVHGPEYGRPGVSVGMVRQVILIYSPVLRAGRSFVKKLAMHAPTLGVEAMAKPRRFPPGTDRNSRLDYFSARSWPGQN